MHSKLILFCIALMFIRCSSSVEQKKPTVVQEKKPLSIEKESIQVYQLLSVQIPNLLYLNNHGIRKT